MEGVKKIFKISFKALLSDVTQSLQWPKPIYNQLENSNKVAYLVLRVPSGSSAHYFEGKECLSLLESEEAAVEEAVDCLALKYKLRIEDINLENRERYKKLAEFYKALREELVELEKAGNNVPSKLCKTKVLNDLGRIISINFKGILANILMEYKINVTNVEYRKIEVGGCIYCFAMECVSDELTIEWVIGHACDNMIEAEQNAAKKAIVLLKTKYDFDVVDANYYRMCFAYSNCASQREKYFAMKEKVLGIKENVITQPILSGECTTPKGVEYQIPYSSIPPQPPKKRRCNLSICTSSTKNVVQIKEELDVIYKHKAIIGCSNEKQAQ